VIDIKKECIAIKIIKKKIEELKNDLNTDINGMRADLKTESWYVGIYDSKEAITKFAILDFLRDLMKEIERKKEEKE